MKIKIEYTEEDLKQLIINDLESKIEIPFNKDFLHIQVKSSQNFKAEWETANFKAVYEKVEL
jgi:ribosome maturation protein Sdo1